MRGSVQTILALVLAGFIAYLANMQRRVDVEIDLTATPAEVWSVISATDAYGDWNPTLTRMDGAPQTNGPLSFDFVGADGSTESLSATWIEARPGRYAWESKVGIGRWYDRLYFMRVDVTPEGGTKIRLGAVASGISVLWREEGFASRTEPALTHMLQALAAHLGSEIR